MSDSEPAKARRGRRGEPLLEPVAWVVLVAGVLATLLGVVLSTQTLDRRADARLTETADELEQQLDQVSTGLQRVGTELGAAVVATDADADDVERLMRPLAREDPLVTGIQILVADQNGLAFYADNGTVRALDDIDPIEPTFDSEKLTQMIATLREIEPGDVAIIDRSQVEDFEVVDVAFDVEGAALNFLVFVELAIPTALFEDAAGDSDFAFYLSGTDDEDRLALATTEDLPLSGVRTSRALAFGEQSALLVVAPTADLLTPMERATPWIILGVGLLLTLVATPVVHNAARRRQQLRTLRAEKAELDEALTQLRASEERFRSVLISSPDVITMIENEGELHVLNRDDFFGYELEDVSDILAISHEDDEEGAREDLEILLGADPGTITQFELRLRDATSEDWHWMRVRGGVGQQNPDKESYVLAVFTEISEQKREEQRRAELEAQLVQSQRLEAVGQLAGGVAHDFNNILAAILSGAELILDEVPEGEAHEDVVEIQNTARRGADLSRQLLMFSRGEPSSSPEVLDVGAVVREMERMLNRSISEQIRLETELAEDLRPIFADKGEIERIVMNLTLNARDAMPEEGGTITIRATNLVADDEYVGTRVDLEAGDYVNLEVIDTGSGMEPETVRRAFEPFFSTKDVGKGTGLGLASVYGIVQNRRGHIEIDSEPGNGTTIRILLPVTRLDQPIPGPTHEVEIPEGNGERILLVEDEEAVRNATCRLLERRGYVVSAVPDGDAAIRAAASDEFDLVLTDVLLPGGMNGREVAEHLRGDHPDVAVVYMTGHSRDILEGVGLDLEELILIRKPFEEDRLLAMVRTAIDRAEGPHRGSPEADSETQAEGDAEAEGDTQAEGDMTSDAVAEDGGKSSTDASTEPTAESSNETTGDTENVVESLR
jgi:hypothetical protein